MSMTDNERAAMVAAKRYARQFRNGRSFDRITGYAQTDFLAGVAWLRTTMLAQLQKAEKPIDPNLACDLCHPNGKRSLGSCAYCRVLPGLGQVKHD